MGLQARFSVKSNAGYEEICLSCRFPEPSAARLRNPIGHHHHRKLDTRTESAQTEPVRMRNTTTSGPLCVAFTSGTSRHGSTTASAVLFSVCATAC
jgi:hypothetical protein